MNFPQYIITAAFCLSLFYITYRLIFRRNSNFLHARIFILASVILSLIIPLSDYTINTGFNWFQKDTAAIIIPSETLISATLQPDRDTGLWHMIRQTDWSTLVVIVYASVSIILLLRVLVTIIILYLQFSKSYKVHLSDCILLYNHRFRNTFSFFRWIFLLHPDSEEDLAQIIAHERIHVNQYHSLDILIVELLTAVMWFNPFVWMMKSSLQLVHEYLADDGVLDSGIDRMKYQALLINQVAEEKLISLSSSFNQSLIKKRILMMTKSRIQRKSMFRLMAVLPVSLLLLLFISVVNGVFSEDLKASGTGTLTMVNANPELTTDGTVMPPDTIIKKTVIKKISKANPNDTIVVEKEEIITGEDAIDELERIDRTDGDRHRVVVIHDDGEETISHSRDGERREVRVRVEDGEETVIHSRDGRRYSHIDTVKTTRHGGGEEIIVSRDKPIIIRLPDGAEKSKILYIIDGVKHTESTALDNIDPDDIQEMSVFKGEQAKKYTPDDYEGVIVITTKKGKSK